MWKEVNDQNAIGAYQVNGEGAPLLLIHGFPENGAIWEHQQNKLQERYRVITPDLPGSGNSPLTYPLSIESMADFVHAIVLAEGIDKVVIAGHSMGGYVALAFAEKYPHLLQGLGLVHSTAAADTEEKKEARRKSIKLMEQYGAEAFIRQAVPGMFSPATKSSQPALVDALVQMGMQCRVEALLAYYEAMLRRPDRKAVLEKAGVPVLFIIGKDDTAVPIDSVLPQVTLPRRSSIHIFEDTGHMGMWETAEASTLALQQFMDFCQL
ncbi:alpha/beta fold hydrolase [Chitinophaga japonensis]|uniref:Pimeloyl-ACP methyl ester carboxylesterase n=1 Tax=Chitinophaga japonensis TaxID=104662 RepID=A0A562TAS5_CHIJA|nr:alpha/beta hydrolase [Chitinophaga japonensis]TWI90741.1 pimeloyl-ACP methyl ester carboxylesterase [Chitinophaga japonensis]